MSRIWLGCSFYEGVSCRFSGEGCMPSAKREPCPLDEYERAATADRLARFLAEHYGCPPNSRDYCDCATCDPDADEAEHLATCAKCWIRLAEEDGL